MSVDEHDLKCLPCGCNVVRKHYSNPLHRTYFAVSHCVFHGNAEAEVVALKQKVREEQEAQVHLQDEVNHWKEKYGHLRNHAIMADEHQEHVAYLCYRRNGSYGSSTIQTCDQDTEGAFKVYRHPSEKMDAILERLSAEAKTLYESIMDAATEGM